MQANTPLVNSQAKLLSLKRPFQLPTPAFLNRALRTSNRRLSLCSWGVADAIQVAILRVAILRNRRGVSDVDFTLEPPPSGHDHISKKHFSIRKQTA